MAWAQGGYIQQSGCELCQRPSTPVPFSSCHQAKRLLPQRPDPQLPGGGSACRLQGAAHDTRLYCHLSRSLRRGADVTSGLDAA
jgi:hypothetical protein